MEFEMIRVLQVLGGLNRGGAETMVMNLYRATDKSKVQFDFIVHSEKEDAYADEIRSLGGKIYVFPKFRLKNYFSYKKCWDVFLKEHPEYKILHSHVRSYASLYLPIAKKHGVKTIIHSHSTSNGKGISSIVKRVMQSSLKRRADYLFACSAESGKWLFGEKAVKKENYRMIPNAVDTSKFAFNSESRREIRASLGIGEDTVVYGHVGRFHPAKNHAFLLEVFCEVLKKDANAVLLVAGDGALRAEIERKIAELGISESVKLLGSRPDVAELMSAMDAFVFPSLWEGLPVTVVEAQASGLPCFVSDTVTRDVYVSSLVKYLPINEGVNIWADELTSSSFERKDVIENIKNAGFDVTESAKKLSEFYMELCNG
jgi:glycosyltransferase involved in cell wall biosynthesis